MCHDMFDCKWWTWLIVIGTSLVKLWSIFNYLTNKWREPDLPLSWCWPYNICIWSTHFLCLDRIFRESLIVIRRVRFPDWQHAQSMFLLDDGTGRQNFHDGLQSTCPYRTFAMILRQVTNWHIWEQPSLQHPVAVVVSCRDISRIRSAS